MLNYVIDKYHFSIHEMSIYTSNKCKKPNVRVVKRELISHIIYEETNTHVPLKIMNSLVLMFGWKVPFKVTPGIASNFLYLKYYTHHTDYPYPVPIYFLSWVLDNPEQLIEESRQRYEQASKKGKKR
jgi:hypothetical protein